MVGNTLTDKDRIDLDQHSMAHKLTLQSENALPEGSRKHAYRVSLSFVPVFPWLLVVWPESLTSLLENISGNHVSFTQSNL